MNEKWKERLKAIAPKVGFPLFYLFCLALFARWTLPWDKVRDRAVLTFDEGQRSTGGQQELKIDELGPSWFSIQAKGIRLLGPPSEPGKPPSEMKIDEARVGVIGALFGDYGFHVEAFGGTIKGDYADSSKERKIDVTIDGINLGQAEPIAQALGVPVEGTLDAAIKLTMPEGKASKATGALTVDAKDVAVGDGKAKMKNVPLALPRLVIGPLAVAGEAKDGVLKLSKLSAGGKDLELAGDGRVQLRDSFAESITDVNLRFKINDAYKSKNDTTKSLFGAPGSSMPALLEMDPKVKQSKRADGFYAWHMRGQIGKPEFDPAPSTAAAPGALTPPPASTPRAP
jgi:type II secretion system protein N